MATDFAFIFFDDFHYQRSKQTEEWWSQLAILTIKVGA